MIPLLIHPKIGNQLTLLQSPHSYLINICIRTTLDLEVVMAFAVSHV